MTLLYILRVEFAYSYKFVSIFIGSNFRALAVSLLFDAIAELLEGIAVTPVFAADKAEAVKAAKELFPGHRVTVVLKEGEPGS